MKLISFGADRVGIVLDDEVVDLTVAAHLCPDGWPPLNMIRLIARFDECRPAIEQALTSWRRHRFTTTSLNAPIRWPNKLIAFPANYDAHIAEMRSPNRANRNGFFLKANSALSAPSAPIVLPTLPGREIHHEGELAVIIGRRGRHVPAGKALDHVFGYTCLLDITVRGPEERVMRKSHDSFCPLGPWITTRDEIANPDDLALELTVNGEVRQAANTRDLIVSVPELIELTSSVATLEPGDVIATGTPAGVGPIRHGDVVSLAIERVGQLTVDVIAASKPAPSPQTLGAQP